MVASFTQLLAERYKGKIDDKADKFIHYSVDGAKRMQILINDLLTYSRVGTEGKPKEKIEISEVVRHVLEDLGPAIQSSKAKINVGEMPSVKADRTQIRQLFQNLIENAIKFRSENSPVIDITAERHEADWLFEVKDNGIGIDPQFHDRIFTIFQRLHERDKFPGTGIGLAVVKKIIERHGGKIAVESEPGSGSCFTFSMPAE